MNKLQIPVVRETKLELVRRKVTLKDNTTLAETGKKEAKRGERFLLLYDFYYILFFCFYLWTAQSWLELDSA